MNEKHQADIRNMDFESAFAALQENVVLLESEDLPLEKALEYYARGQALAKRCADLLEEAELQVRELAMTDAQLPEEEA